MNKTCRICGDVARGMNFDVLTCVSCKAFFRRNAFRSVKTFRCTQEFNCPVTKVKRSYCGACRLKKCFASGMNPRLIRSFNQFHLPTPRPIGLLENDRSKLRSEEWTLFSNVMHANDEENLLQSLKSYRDERSALPIKFRSKSSLTMEYLFNSLSWIKSLLKRSFHFHHLPIISRQIILRQNILSSATLNGMMTARSLTFVNDPSFLISYEQTFGNDLLEQVLQIHQHLDQNDVLIKMMLFVIAFSTNSTHVALDYSLDQSLITSNNAIELVRIQDIFVTLLWKYLVYQFGSTEAIIRYSSLIKVLLDIIRLKEKMSRVPFYHQMIRSTINQIEHSLITSD